ncbi:MAG: serine/threonine-protein kinase [Aquisalimonadaceae bacterium]
MHPIPVLGSSRLQVQHYGVRGPDIAKDAHRTIAMDKGHQNDGVAAPERPRAPRRPGARGKHGRQRKFPPGTVLMGRYLLICPVASGGTSQVYKARDLLAERGGDAQADVAVKIVSGIDDSRIALDIALHEVSINRTLSHPGIIRVHDVHWDGSVCFLTMDWLAGESLAQRLSRSPGGRLSLPEATAIAVAVADALEAAHLEGVVHSDVKPANILLTDDGRVKVIDFAIARRARSAPAPGAGKDNTPSFFGHSISYASPETLRDEAADTADDVYSLACVLYEMVSGRRPFPDRSSLEARRDGLRPRRPKGLGHLQWQILRKALSLTRERRFTGIRRFVALFRAARHGGSAATLLGAAILFLGIP